VFGGLRKALRPRGLLVFSVEAAAEGGAGFILQPSHRYAHTLAYLRQLAAQHGFAVKAVEECIGRQENGAGIAAYALTMAAPG
jgi:predicted TPR repeat methyltransferase